MYTVQAQCETELTNTIFGNMN